MKTFDGQAESSSAAQEARVTRGLVEGADYTFLPDRPGTWICHSVSGHTYRVSTSSCNCPDHQYRNHGSELVCKHRVALSHKLIADGTDLVTEGLAVLRKREAEEHAAFDRIFG